MQVNKIKKKELKRWKKLIKQIQIWINIKIKHKLLQLNKEVVLIWLELHIIDFKTCLTPDFSMLKWNILKKFLLAPVF